MSLGWVSVPSVWYTEVNRPHPVSNALGNIILYYIMSITYILISKVYSPVSGIVDIPIIILIGQTILISLYLSMDGAIAFCISETSLVLR